DRRLCSDRGRAAVDSRRGAGADVAQGGGGTGDDDASGNPELMSKGLQGPSNPFPSFLTLVLQLRGGTFGLTPQSPSIICERDISLWPALGKRNRDSDNGSCTWI